MAEIITVRAAKANHKAVLWDVDDRHPGGEVFISGNDRTHDVAETPAVLKALSAGTLVKVTLDEARAVADTLAPESTDGVSAEDAATALTALMQASPSPDEQPQDATDGTDTTDEPSDGAPRTEEPDAAPEAAALVSDESGVIGATDAPEPEPEPIVDAPADKKRGGKRS